MRSSSTYIHMYTENVYMHAGLLNLCICEYEYISRACIDRRDQLGLQTWEFSEGAAEMPGFMFATRHACHDGTYA
jgi:hypothetical protein